MIEQLNADRVQRMLQGYRDGFVRVTCRAFTGWMIMHSRRRVRSTHHFMEKV